MTTQDSTTPKYVVTLTKLKHHIGLSDETNAFDATVCINGQPIATAENTGKGGSTDIHPIMMVKGKFNETLGHANRATLNEVEQWVKATTPCHTFLSEGYSDEFEANEPSVRARLVAGEQIDGYYLNDLENLIDHLVYLDLEAKEEARIVKQIKGWCAKQTLFTLPGDKEGHYRTINHVWNDAVKAHMAEKYPNAIIINADPRYQ